MSDLKKLIGMASNPIHGREVRAEPFEPATLPGAVRLGMAGSGPPTRRATDETKEWLIWAARGLLAFWAFVSWGMYNDIQRLKADIAAAQFENKEREAEIKSLSRTKADRPQGTCPPSEAYVPSKR
jgi:hypothetical protein